MHIQSFTRLEALRKANTSHTYINDRIYRLMFREDLYIAAYEKIKSKPGNMTAGVDGTTLDEFSIRTIRNIIEKMKDESFSFRGAKRVTARVVCVVSAQADPAVPAHWSIG